MKQSANHELFNFWDKCYLFLGFWSYSAVVIIIIITIIMRTKNILIIIINTENSLKWKNFEVNNSFNQKFSKDIFRSYNHNFSVIIIEV